MSDYPVGIVRKAAGGTIGITDTNFRIFSVYLKGATLSATSVTFYAGKGNPSGSTANALFSVYLNASNPTYNSIEFGEGVLFNNGCYMTTAAAIDYVTIVGMNEY